MTENGGMRGIESVEGVQIHHPSKAKIATQTKKLRGKTKGRERNRSSRGRSCPHRPWLPPQATRGSHQGPRLPLASPSRLLPEHHVLVHLLVSGFCLCLVILGLFCYLLWSYRPQQKYLLILWFRLINSNSSKTFKTSKTTHNRRNMA